MNIIPVTILPNPTQAGGDPVYDEWVTPGTVGYVNADEDPDEDGDFYFYRTLDAAHVSILHTQGIGRAVTCEEYTYVSQHCVSLGLHANRYPNISAYIVGDSPTFNDGRTVAPESFAQTGTVVYCSKDAVPDGEGDIKVYPTPRTYSGLAFTGQYIALSCLRTWPVAPRPAPDVSHSPRVRTYTVGAYDEPSPDVDIDRLIKDKVDAAVNDALYFIRQRLDELEKPLTPEVREAAAASSARDAAALEIHAARMDRAWSYPEGYTVNAKTYVDTLRMLIKSEDGNI